MKHKITAVVLTTLFVALLLFGWAIRARGTTLEVVQPQIATSTEPALTHAQLVWTYALEWCESNGNIDAVNKVDRDGTSSYYSWQWKPSTFKLFANLYGVVPTSTNASTTRALMHDYATERKVIEAMVRHRTQINFRQQFPDCVRRLGKPPASVTI